MNIRLKIKLLKDIVNNGGCILLSQLECNIEKCPVYNECGNSNGESIVIIAKNELDKLVKDRMNKIEEILK